MCTNSDLHRVCACIFNSWKVCAQILYSSLLTGMGSVLVYSILEGYVHKFFGVLTYMGFVPTYSILGGYMHKFFDVLTHEEVLGERFTGENNSLRSAFETYGGAFLVTWTYWKSFDRV